MENRTSTISAFIKWYNQQNPNRKISYKAIDHFKESTKKTFIESLMADKVAIELQKIKKIVEKHCGIADLSKKTNKPEVSHARFLYYFLCYSKATRVVAFITESVGYDRTSFYWAKKQVESFRNDKTWVYFGIIEKCLFEIEKDSTPSTL